MVPVVGGGGDVVSGVEVAVLGAGGVVGGVGGGLEGVGVGAVVVVVGVVVAGAIVGVVVGWTFSAGCGASLLTSDVKIFSGVRALFATITVRVASPTLPAWSVAR